MLIGSGFPLPEEWRRCTKVIMGAEGDHAYEHSTEKRLND
jgi:hypothetical protein